MPEAVEAYIFQRKDVPALRESDVALGDGAGGEQCKAFIQPCLRFYFDPSWSATRTTRPPSGTFTRS